MQRLSLPRIPSNDPLSLLSRPGKGRGSKSDFRHAFACVSPPRSPIDLLSREGKKRWNIQTQLLTVKRYKKNTWNQLPISQIYKLRSLKIPTK